MKTLALILTTLVLVFFQFTQSSAFTIKRPFKDSLSDHVEIIKHENKAATQISLNPSEEYTVLSWNIEKTKDKSFYRDFNQLKNNGLDIVHFQESLLTEEFQNLVETSPLNWSTAVSFKIFKNLKTGISVGSRFLIKKIKSFKSPDTEPITKTPKVSLFSYVKIQGTNTTLLLANVHLINFVSIQKFKNHLNQIILEISKHDGPVIFAGDFNSWSENRKRYIMKVTRTLSLNLVDFPRLLFYETFRLDHFFVRGITVTHKKILTHIKSSDHYPLLIKFKLNQ